MILAALDSIDAETGPWAAVAAELEFLRCFDGRPWEGRRDIRGGKSFALYQAYETKPPAGAKFEAHRQWIDLQFVWQGKESILQAPLSRLGPPDTPYDATRDAALWNGSLVPDFSALRLAKGDLAVFFPEDAHAPGLEAGGSHSVVKVVVKVAI